MTAQSTELAVQKTLLVAAPQTHAFSVFTEQMTSWWPLETHHIASVPAKRAVVEPKAGGRWYEEGEDGSECDWGRVLVWEPPARLVLAWQLTADWQYDPNFVTELEVRFVAEGDQRTRVELEHRNLERHGDRAEEIRAALDSEGGWTGILASYAKTAAA